VTVFQRKDGFARLIHRLDCLLVAGGGGPDAKLTAGVYPNRLRPSDRHSTNTGDKCGSLIAVADANRVAIPACTTIANVDVVTAGGQ